MKTLAEDTTGPSIAGHFVLFSFHLGNDSSEVNLL